MEFYRQEYGSGLPFPTLGELADPGIKPVSLVSPALAGRFFTTVSPGKPLSLSYIYIYIYIYIFSIYIYIYIYTHTYEKTFWTFNSQSPGWLKSNTSQVQPCGKGAMVQVLALPYNQLTQFFICKMT